MTARALLRLVGSVALTAALGVGVVHAVAVSGRAAVSSSHLLAVTFPILVGSGLSYIVATHRLAPPPRPPRWMLLAWTASAVYMAVNASRGAPATPAGELRELSGHLLALLIVVGLGLFAVARREARSKVPPACGLT